jgi:ribosomal protein S18 acetylase RimI-like enzyme
MVHLQFQAQNGGYRVQYPDSEQSIILIGDQCAGRIWVDRAAARFLLVDISILPAFQNRGLGTALVSSLVAEAAGAGVSVECHVALTNPGSLRFHQRLGFEVLGHDGLYYSLERRP